MNWKLIIALSLIVVMNSSLMAEEAEWIELIGAKGLSGWDVRPRGADHEWRVGGGAELDSENSKKLQITDGTGVIQNGYGGKTGDLFAFEEGVHADCELHVEFMVPEGSNSGVYFMGRYEIQILDSWGEENVESSDCGGIYQRWDPSRGEGHERFEGRAPNVNASRPPGEWQSFDVIFRSPIFDKEGKKLFNAKFEKVLHNGKLVHENVEVGGPTRAAAFQDEQPMGPLMLQGDHGPVAFRNIRIKPIPAREK